MTVHSSVGKTWHELELKLKKSSILSKKIAKQLSEAAQKFEADIRISKPDFDLELNPSNVLDMIELIAFMKKPPKDCNRKIVIRAKGKDANEALLSLAKIF